MNTPESLLTDIAAYLGEVVGTIDRAKEGVDEFAWIKLGPMQSDSLAHKARTLIDRIFPEQKP